MKILVIWTPDGPEYFRGDRNASKIRATDVAADVVMNASERYDLNDREAIRSAKENSDYRKLYAALVAIRAIREEQLQD